MPRKESSCRESFTLFIPKNEKGIIAFGIVELGRSPKIFNTFVEVDASQEKPVKLDEHWLPSFDRQGGIDGYGNVWVRIGDMIYTSSRHPNADEVRIDDPDVLCRFLYGIAEPEQVIAAADEMVVEKSRVERIKELEARVKELETDAESRIEHTGKLMAESYELTTQCEQLEKARSGLVLAHDILSTKGILQGRIISDLMWKGSWWNFGQRREKRRQALEKVSALSKLEGKSPNRDMLVELNRQLIITG